MWKEFLLLVLYCRGNSNRIFFVLLVFTEYVFAGGFRVTGRIATQCSLTEPLMGELIVEKSAVPIYSIDVQLFRVESVAAGDRMATESSEIQSTQVNMYFELDENAPDGCLIAQSKIGKWRY